MNYLLAPQVSISVFDFCKWWLLPGVVASIIGDPIVCYLAWYFSPKRPSEWSKSASSGSTAKQAKVRSMALTLILQILIGLGRTMILFSLTFWARYYVLDNNTVGAYDKLIPEDDTADEEEIISRMYADSLLSAFNFVKLHWILNNFAMSYFTHLFSSVKADHQIFDPLNPPTVDANIMMSNKMTMSISTLCKVASIILYAWVVFCFVYQVLAFRFALLAALVYVTVMALLYWRVLYQLYALATKKKQAKQD